MYLKIDNIEEVHLELTSKCNLFCPQCARSFDGIPNKYVIKTDLDYGVLDHLFTEEFSKQLKLVYINGNYGDVVAHSDTIKVLKLLKDRGVRKVLFYTNGSAQKPEWWTEIATILKDPSDEVIFSIDGLEDTNHIYRIGSNWGIIMNSVKAFIAAGGRARWEYLVFEHNEHQVKEAEMMAHELGFKAFKYKLTSRFKHSGNLDDNKYNESIQAQGTNKNAISVPQNKKYKSSNLVNFTDIISKHGDFKSYINNTIIECKSKKLKSVYIDVMGDVWPCCWLGTPRFGHPTSEGNKDFNKIKEKYGIDFNSLKTHTLNTVLNHAWFNSDLEDSWNSNNDRLFVCGKTCGSEYEHSTGLSKTNSTVIDLK